jgi:isoleucyl-tRNA synthetase
VGELTVTQEMLKVTKQFNETYSTSKQWAVASNEVSVMLDCVQTESLMQHGLSREITNRIQRLRKTSGISIEDQIEIFYYYSGSASPDSELGRVVKNYSDKIQ